MFNSIHFFASWTAAVGYRTSKCTAVISLMFTLSSFSTYPTDISPELGWWIQVRVLDPSFGSLFAKMYEKGLFPGYLSARTLTLRVVSPSMMIFPLGSSPTAVNRLLLLAVVEEEPSSLVGNNPAIAHAVLAAFPPPSTSNDDDLIFSSGSGKWSTVATKSTAPNPTDNIFGCVGGGCCCILNPSTGTQKVVAACSFVVEMDRRTSKVTVIRKATPGPRSWDDDGVMQILPMMP
mmetsp:Transcript_42439/g.102206  ORF Transcript_42439/g.102206 Transcript_42439/m.102206 type:complete len:234 (-) Transcript_42439:294-995(-)